MLNLNLTRKTIRQWDMLPDKGLGSSKTSSKGYERPSGVKALNACVVLA